MDNWKEDTGTTVAPPTSVTYTHPPYAPPANFYGTEGEKSASLDEVFRYHEARPDQVPRYALVRAAGLTFAQAITNVCPKSADRTAAIRKVREAVMTANAAITLDGAV